MNALETPLEVAAIRLFEVAIPLAEPFRISGGELRDRRSLIVELTDSSGAVGYGESAPFAHPFYSEETLTSVRACLTETLFPRLRGHAFGALESAIEAVSQGIRGNRMARAGVETALWDLACVKAGVSLTTLLAAAMERMGVGGPMRVARGFVESGAALGIPEPGGREPGKVLGAWAAAALEAGHRRVKVKVRPGWDVEAVRAVRQAALALGRPVRIWADANGAYRRSRDLERLRALDREGLELLEQPLEPDDLLGTIRLARELATPLCLDESLVDDHAAELFLAGDGPRVWNLKVQRVGGLWEALKIYRRAVSAGVILWGGTMPETGIGAHAIVCLGSFAGFTYPTDVAPSRRWFAPGADLIEIAMDAEARIRVSDAPGLYRLGVKERLERGATPGASGSA